MVSAVRALNEAPSSELLVGALARALVHLAREPRARATYEADLARLLRAARRAERVAFEDGERHFLGVGGERGGPGDREGVRGPEGHAGHPHVCVAAWAWVPVADEVDCEAHGFAGHGFDFDGGALLKAEAVVEDGGGSAGVLKGPEDEDEMHPWDLREVVHGEMLVETDERSADRELVDVEEALVECVAERRPCLDADECEGARADHSPAVGAFSAKSIGDVGPSISFAVAGVVQECDSVDDGLEDGDASGPSVEEIEVIVRDLEE